MLRQHPEYSLCCSCRWKWYLRGWFPPPPGAGAQIDCSINRLLEIWGLNVTSLDKFEPTPHSQLRAQLINGSTLLTAFYLEWRSLLCVGVGAFVPAETVVKIFVLLSHSPVVGALLQLTGKQTWGFPLKIYSNYQTRCSLKHLPPTEWCHLIKQFQWAHSSQSCSLVD